MLLVRDTSLAEDISQDVFLRVFRKLDTLADPNRFVPWVMTIARNAAYDSGRARKRRPLKLVGEEEILDRAVDHDPHLSMEIHDALDRLDLDLKEALVLVGVMGLTYAEAAESLGIPEGTMKSRVFRARSKMMAILEEGVTDVS